MNHYFQPDPKKKEDFRVIETSFQQQSFSFVTHSGVFSKKGIDYGSRLLIESVEIGTAKKILDLGCGYGPIGITIASLHPTCQVYLVDINEQAVELAKLNAQRNHVIDNTEIFTSNGFQMIQDHQFDLILCNPPIRAGKSIVYSLFAETKNYLNPDGRFCIVIRKQQGANSAIKELSRHFPSVELINRKKGYWVVQAGLV